MKGLILKDLCMTAKYCRAYLVIVVAFLAVSLFGDDNMFFIIYPIMITGMIPVTLISCDEREKWTAYSGTLPYTRAQLVSAKYIIGLLFSTAVLTVAAAAQLIRMYAVGGMDTNRLAMLISLFLTVGLISPSLLLPFIFKYGAEKGRIVYFAVIGIICGVSVVLQQSNTVLDLSAAFNAKWVLPAVCTASAALYAASWLLSIAFYKKREL